MSDGEYGLAAVSSLSVRAAVWALAAAAILAFDLPARACPCGPGCSCGPACACAAPLRVRKNQNSLSEQEKQDFVSAVLRLKATFRPGSTLSIYDQFVQQHGESFTAGHAHAGPAFLPWHRQFLLQFERELQQVNPNVTIPYWDFTVDRTPDASLWRPDFLGGNGDPAEGFAVTDGPFRRGEWVLVFDGPDLRRNFGRLVPELPTPDDVKAALDVGRYDAPPYNRLSPVDQSFRNNLEGFNHPTFFPELHNRVHLWLGGSSEIIYSPNDPVFWLLHANIDRLWAEWQAKHDPDYLPVMGAQEGHNLHDRMSPFGVAPADVLDHHALGYRYDTEPAVVPAPGGLALLALGALGLLGWQRGRRAKARDR